MNWAALAMAADSTRSLTGSWTGSQNPKMFRAKRNKEAATTPEPAAGKASPSSGYNRSELTTFDGRGNPTVIVYSTDSLGRSVKTPRRGGRKSH